MDELYFKLCSADKWLVGVRNGCMHKHVELSFQESL